MTPIEKTVPSPDRDELVEALQAKAFLVPMAPTTERAVWISDALTALDDMARAALSGTSEGDKPDRPKQESGEPAKVPWPFPPGIVASGGCADDGVREGTNRTTSGAIGQP